MLFGFNSLNVSHNLLSFCEGLCSLWSISIILDFYLVLFLNRFLDRWFERELRVLGRVRQLNFWFCRVQKGLCVYSLSLQFKIPKLFWDDDKFFCVSPNQRSVKDVSHFLDRRVCLSLLQAVVSLSISSLILVKLSSILRLAGILIFHQVISLPKLYS